ncbi:TetR family transcriptional regulator [Paenibacillus taihuensis]|uniref:TetR family transcriptional regulator n=1 Tax=Paenibacillus taihuensis TaxID=1156355 RepID=A0A3D9RVJ9_9BACL|nr:TniQ family protein [Paenibacillus taihuensis]REE81564.1 TetR family transcriptional regulator [Paenibacillus taihuensis]
MTYRNFQSWYEELPSLHHTTTRLYSLAPIGRGTCYVESLSGYIARLAAEHCTTTGRLFTDVFSSYLDKHYLNEIVKRGGNGFFDAAHMINGNARAAEQFSTMMSNLTGVAEFTDFTLHRFRMIIPQRGLLKRHKTWCGDCYREMKQSQTGIVFEPLIWQIGVVSICNEHNRVLMDRCPECNKTSLVLDRRSIPGHCPHCKAWLGRHSGLSAENDYEAKMRAAMIKRLLENKVPLKRSGIASSLSRIIVSNDTNSTELARRLDVPKTTFWTWTNGRNLPSLIEVIRICNKFGIDIVDFYQGLPNGEHLPVIFKKRKKKTNLKLTTRPLYVVKQMAKSIVADNTNGHMHVQAMADALSCNKKTLYNHFPALCKAQSIKRQRFLNKQKEERIDRLRYEIDDAFNEVTRFERPTKRRLEGRLGRPCVFREREIKDHYKNLRAGG